MIRTLLLLCCLLGSALPALAEEADHAIHEELRGVLKTVETAINSGDFDKMLPVLSEQVRATPINQEFLSGRPAVSAYFKKWFGQGGYLKKLEMQLSADELTELSADKSWGLVRGTGVEKYILADGRPYELHTRWTATMAREADSQWRIRGIHIGTDFLDNPILSEAEHALGKAAGLGALGGLLLGLGSGWLLFRRKQKV
ncbi:MAG: nuclear transport factor 2 family protein [Azonexus sp.]